MLKEISTGATASGDDGDDDPAAKAVAAALEVVVVSTTTAVTDCKNCRAAEASFWNRFASNHSYKACGVQVARFGSPVAVAVAAVLMTAAAGLAVETAVGLLLGWLVELGGHILLLSGFLFQ